MKLLFTIAFSLITSAAMACTDFSGTYLNHVENTPYSLSQSGCASITEENETIYTDGRYRVIAEDDSVAVSMAASFIGANLTMDSNIEYKIPFPPEVPADMVPTKVVIVYTLDSARNLQSVSTVYNSTGQVLATESGTDQRQ
jgi:hypothetical protein